MCLWSGSLSSNRNLRIRADINTLTSIMATCFPRQRRGLTKEIKQKLYPPSKAEQFSLPDSKKVGTNLSSSLVFICFFRLSAIYRLQGALSFNWPTSVSLTSLTSIRRGTMDQTLGCRYQWLTPANFSEKRYRQNLSTGQHPTGHISTSTRIRHHVDRPTCQHINTYKHIKDINT